MARALRGAVAAVALVLLAGACTFEGAGTAGAGRPTIALLLPESKTARYETQDRPRFQRRVRELCPSCRVLYTNAGQETSVQQSQAEAALINGAGSWSSIRSTPPPPAPWWPRPRRSAFRW